MPVYVYEAKDGEQIEELCWSYSDAPLRIKRGGKQFKRVIASASKKMTPETTSPKYQAWFHSEPVQAKLKSGEYFILPKSDSVNHY